MQKTRRAGTTLSGRGLPEAGLVDWFFNHPELQRRPQAGARPSPAEQFISHLWPASLQYYSPLSPVFLNEISEDEARSGQSRVWHVRDGLVPLLWFFKSNPVPRNFGSRLLVHERFAGFVPPAWSRHVGTYRLRSLQPPPRKGKRKLLIVGIAMEAYCSAKYLDQYLERIVGEIGKRELKRADMVSFLPGRFHGWGDEHHQEFHGQFMITLCRHLGTRIDAINWKKFECTRSWDGYEVIDLNEGLLCADNFVVHQALALGARLLDPGRDGEEKTDGAPGTSGPPGRPDRLVRISSRHGVEIVDRISGNAASTGQVLLKNAGDSDLLFEEAMRSEANKRFPWPAWFEKWAVHTARLHNTTG